MDIRTCFTLLDLDPNATIEEAKLAYKAQVRRWHPDQFPAGSVTQMGAQEQLKRINIAYARIKAHIPSRPHRPTAPQKQSASRSRSRAHKSQAQRAPSRKTKKHGWLDTLFDMLNTFSDHHATSSTPSRQKKTTAKKQKRFDQVLGEMTGDTISKDTRSSRKSFVRSPMPNRHRKNRGSTIGSVEGIKSPDPIRPIGRIRGIGRNR